MFENFNIEFAVKKLRQYWGTYEQQPCWKTLHENIFMDDALYGLGLSIDEDKYKYAQGFREFKKDLYEHLKKEQAGEFKQSLRMGKRYE